MGKTVITWLGGFRLFYLRGHGSSSLYVSIRAYTTTFCLGLFSAVCRPPMLIVIFLYLCLYVLMDAIYIFSVAFCPCILNIYGRLVRCNVSADPPSLLTVSAAHLLHLKAFVSLNVFFALIDTCAFTEVFSCCTL